MTYGCERSPEPRHRGSGWRLTDTLEAPGRTHFEYAQREVLTDLPLLVT